MEPLAWMKGEYTKPLVRGDKTVVWRKVDMGNTEPLACGKRMNGGQGVEGMSSWHGGGMENGERQSPCDLVE